MQATTIQVRKVMHNAITAHNARAGSWYGVHSTYTEKTSKRNAKRRSVVYVIDNDKAAVVLQQVQNEFNTLGYTNKVKTTGDGMYLRCIADVM